MNKILNWSQANLILIILVALLVAMESLLAHRAEHKNDLYIDPDTKCQYFNETKTIRYGTDGFPLGCANQIPVEE